ncbi:MAG: RluA family pseudouridine synthase [Patescibacteria group bacterium]|nr:RluA family pseudouridine synthase [Patescibacteria group bacterium]
MEPIVLYEDDDIIVIDKPAGLIVHSDGRTIEPSVAEWAVQRYPALADVGEPWVSPQGETVLRPGIVHRLDRTTSGVMVLAKTNEAHAFLKNEFQSRAVQKEYRAYVYGQPKAERGVIEAEIVRIRATPPRWGVARNEGMVVTKERAGRAAVTEWEVFARGADDATGEKASFLAARPKTGRTHQIRVHLQSIHHPVVADHLYAKGRPAILGFARPALHAFQLSLRLPNGAEKTFEAPLPPDFLTAAELFRSEA